MRVISDVVVFSFLQTNLAEPGGTFRRELSQTVITSYNLFHEQQMSIVSIVNIDFVLSVVCGYTDEGLQAEDCLLNSWPKKKCEWTGFEDQFPLQVDLSAFLFKS